MNARHQAVLSRYHYDPLDRLASCSPAASDSIQRFYRMSHLATEIQGQIQRSLVLSEDQLLAQQTRRVDLIESALLGTDQQRSVLNTAEHHQVSYTPYGTRHPVLELPGFNGEQPDPVTGHYLLGNGYRAFNPVLMRFNSPDSLSPFGEGGINAYAYCEGDPVNRVDPTGHMFGFPSFRLRQGVQPPRLRITSNEVVRLQVRPLTPAQYHLVRDIDLFIQQRPIVKTLAYRSFIAVPKAHIERPPIPLPQPILKQLGTAGAKRLAEDRYTHFAAEYRASGSDQAKLDLLRREIWREVNDVTALPSMLKYPADFAEKLRSIRANHRLPQF